MRLSLIALVVSSLASNAMVMCPRKSPQRAWLSEANLTKIRHTIIALAVLKSTSEVAACSGEDKSQCRNDAQNHHHFALKQYSKAIQSMRKAVLDGKQDLRTTLITCIVIICFETYSGDYESTIKQAIIGLDLIEFGQEQVDAMPNQFSSWNEARTYLGLVGGRTLHFMASILPDSHSTGCLTFDIPMPLPSDASFVRLKHSIKIETDESLLAVVGLELQCMACIFSCAVIRSEGQEYPDTKSLMSHFEKMVSLSGTMLTHPRVLSEKRYMRLRCKLYALFMLREALWDSVVVGKLAEWIMVFEEEGLEGEHVPEKSRYMGVDIVDFNMLTRRAQVRCLVPDKDSGSWIRRETVIVW
ncbi:hypothetical protein BDZ45DRAFT_796096 [Acephala macrosclerotiorum]|nr:hypothetical protein BDZ45DRAFT_796096 [Acephala macrosclerotiorum]